MLNGHLQERIKDRSAISSKLGRIGAAAATMLPVAAMLAAILPGAQAGAQSAGAASSPVCMARQGTAPGSGLFVVVVPASAQSAMAGKGYALQACSGDEGAMANYRTRVCHIANAAPAVVQEQFAYQNNVTARELCDLANAVSEG